MGAHIKAFLHDKHVLDLLKRTSFRCSNDLLMKAVFVFELLMMRDRVFDSHLSHSEIEDMLNFVSCE